MPASSKQLVWLDELLQISDRAELRAEFGKRPEFHNPRLLQLIHAEVIRCLYSDRIRARRVGVLAELAGEVLSDDLSRAIVHRCQANLLFAEARYAESIDACRQSIQLFQGAGREAEAGRVYFGGVGALMYLDRYDEALEWAEQARVRFQESGDTLRLARLELNLGNLYYRQDRYVEAMSHYDLARGTLEVSGHPQDFAAVLSNSAVCLTGLGRFSEALANYREALEWCRAQGLNQLAAAANYNVAYLHYLRGEYERAADLYRDSRVHSEAVADHYHRALCDLDESEMMLELNMASLAQNLAAEAADQFKRLGMAYEYAKALVHGALARFRRGDSAGALRMLRDASLVFKKAHNHYWAGLLDLYRAIIYEQDGEWDEAKRLAERARKTLVRYTLTGKFALCNLLLAKLAFRENRLARSQRLLQEASASVLSPALKCHVSHLSGLVEEERGDPGKAAQHYREALQTIEQSRHEFWSRELKISYLQDKAAMYEAFAGLALKSEESDAVAQSFRLVQQAKSRTLLEDLDSRQTRPEDTSDEAFLEAARDLNASYRHVDEVAARQTERATTGLERLRASIESGERSLARLWAERSAERAPASGFEVLSASQICDGMPADSALVEFFIIDDRIHAWLATPTGLRHVKCGEAFAAATALQLLQFQLARYTLGPAYLSRSEASIRKAINAHLAELQGLLIAPIRDLLEMTRVIFAPHSFLHHVPFCVLPDSGGRNLLEDFVVSTIPSASVYAQCSRREAGRGEGALVLAVADDLAPYVLEEASAVAAILPDSELLVGEEATAAALLAQAGPKRYLHVAAHGLQRQDNPLYSAIKLGNSELRLADLDRLRLSADLVTLSGCSTGVSVVTGGDELLGLMRGVLTAGARALLATLWDVSDDATASFMVAFYKNLLRDAGLSPARALRSTMLEMIEKEEDIYRWAAFQMVGVG